MYETLE